MILAHDHPVPFQVSQRYADLVWRDPSAARNVVGVADEHAMLIRQGLQCQVRDQLAVQQTRAEQ